MNNDHTLISERQVIPKENRSSSETTKRFRLPLCFDNRALRDLMQHQIDVLKILRHSNRHALFLEMRLGKTLIMLKHLWHLDTIILNMRALIVAPNSAIGSWRDECEDECLRYEIISGNRKRRIKQIETSATAINIINPDSVRALLPTLCAQHYDVIILDESTVIKNPKAAITKAMITLSEEISYRYILSGKPNPESDLELFCQFKFLFGSFCGCTSYWEFRRKFYNQSRQQQWLWIEKPLSRIRIATEMGIFSSILKRKQVGYDLPKAFKPIYISMPSDWREVYDQLENEFRVKVKNEVTHDYRFAIQVYSALRGLCSGLLRESIRFWDQKIAALESLLVEIDAPCVVWFSSIDAMLRAKEWIRCSEMIYGGVHTTERHAIVRRFQEQKIKTLLIQERVGAHGMNLSIANNVIYFSPPLGLETFEQTQDRTIHMSKDEAVNYYMLLCENSVDVDIYRALKTKGIRSEKLLEMCMKNTASRLAL